MVHVWERGRKMSNWSKGTSIHLLPQYCPKNRPSRRLRLDCCAVRSKSIADGLRGSHHDNWNTPGIRPRCRRPSKFVESREKAVAPYVANYSTSRSSRADIRTRLGSLPASGSRADVWYRLARKLRREGAVGMKKKIK